MVTLSASEDSIEISAALAADAYIGKRIIRTIYRPCCARSSAASSTAPPPKRSELRAALARETNDLTERELAMLEAISRGLSTNVISH